MPLWADALLTVCLPLLAGALIYYVARPHSIRFLAWVDWCLGLRPTPVVQVPGWVAYQLPDGLWAFAFSSAGLLIWRRRIDRQSGFWILLPLLSAIVLEVLFGTFDARDLWFVLAGGLLPFLTHPGNRLLISRS